MSVSCGPQLLCSPGLTVPMLSHHPFCLKLTPPHTWGFRDPALCPPLSELFLIRGFPRHSPSHPVCRGSSIAAENWHACRGLSHRHLPSAASLVLLQNPEASRTERVFMTFLLTHYYTHMMLPSSEELSHFSTVPSHQAPEPGFLIVQIL